VRDAGIQRLGEGEGPVGRPSMAVIGCGGGGCNTLVRAADRGWVLGHHVAANTDAQHLLASRAHRKVLLGRRSTCGLGTNMDMAQGERACIEAADQLADVMSDMDIVVVLSGLGGGTGSGAAPVMAGMARERGSLAISLSTLPFSVEGSTRMDNARVGQANLALRSDVSLVLPNDHLLERFPTMGLLEAFQAADEALLEPVNLMRRLLTSDDVSTIKAAFGGTGEAHLGRGESNRRRGIQRAMDDALAAVYPPIPTRACDRALVMFHAGPDGPVDGELREMVRSLHLAMAEDGMTLWGVVRDEAMGDRLKAVVVVAPPPKR
jgi:cell division protein FtsZ